MLFFDKLHLPSKCYYPSIGFKSIAITNCESGLNKRAKITSIIEELTTDNEEVTTDNEQLSNELADLEQSILDLVPFGRLIEAYGVSPLDGKDCGEIYNKESLKKDGIFASLKTHQLEIEKILNIKLSLDNDNYAVREMNKILRRLEYEVVKKQIQKSEHYWVVNPTI